MDLAEVAADAIRANPHVLERLRQETQVRVERHGGHPVYRALLRAIDIGAPAVIRLLTSDSPEGDLVRSMAPMRTMISRESRQQVIAHSAAQHFAHY